MEAKAFGVVYAAVKALDTSDPNGAFEAVLSTNQVDRDQEVVDAGCFLPLPKSIPIHINHQFTDVAKVVGRGEPYYDGDILRVKGIFASTPDAQTVRSLVAEGMVQTMSVGFHRPKRDMKDGVPHVVSAELIEASFVSVPANTDALVTMAKALDTDLVMPTLKAISDKLDRLLSPATDPETTAVPAAADEKSAAAGTAAAPLADVTVDKARRAALAAEAELLLLTS